MVSPGLSVISTVASIQVSVPALLTRTSPPVIESIFTGVLWTVGEGVGVGVGDGVGVGEGVCVGVGVTLGVIVGVADGVGVGVSVGVSSGSSATVPTGGVIVCVGSAWHPQPVMKAAIMIPIVIK
jgi:hypothetical protein